MKKWWAIATFALAPGWVLALPEADPRELGMSPAILQLVDQALSHYVDAGHVPGLVVAVARHGHIVYQRAMGWQDLEQQIPMRADALFQIRSMTKPVASLAVMQLIEQGRLSLDDPVSHYIPAFADMQLFSDATDFNSATISPQRELLVSDLLLHIGGLSHRDRPLYQLHQVRSRADTLAQLVEKVAAVPLIAEPGTLWNYSISTTVLGRIVELVSGLAFDEYLEQHVFTPLRMEDSGFYVSPAQLAQLTQIYRVSSDGLQPEPPMAVPITELPALIEGAAGMVSTASDYLRFLQSFLNHGELDGQRILGSSGVAMMTQNQLPAELLPIMLSPPTPMPDLGWGYGFSVVIDSSQSPYLRNQGEFGWNGSLGTFSWADPQTGVSAVLMLQIQPSGAYNLAALVKTLVWAAIMDGALPNEQAN